jgi:hypothetical protein
MDILFILIYLVSFAIHLLIEYRENKRFIYNVGDLIDNIHFYMWFPLLNTFILIIAAVGIFLIKLSELSKLDILWEKFRNIRLR